MDTEIVRKHLAGEMTIGIYAINLKTQSSKWVAIDGDYADAYRDLRLLRWELQQDGVQALAEMSRRGAHLWILFDEPLPAKLCRLYIYNLALRLGVPIKGTLKQVDGIEIFPRQDELGADEFGNAIWAPLGIHRANMHRYRFEDAGSNLKDQMNILRGGQKAHAPGPGDVHPGALDSQVPRSTASNPTISSPAWNNGGFHL